MAKNFVTLMQAMTVCRLFELLQKGMGIWYTVYRIRARKQDRLRAYAEAHFEARTAGITTGIAFQKIRVAYQHPKKTLSTLSIRQIVNILQIVNIPLV